MKSTVVAVIAALSQGALAFAPAAAPAPRSGVLALRAQVGLFERVLQMVWICCLLFLSIALRLGQECVPMHVYMRFMRGFACDKIGAAAWLFCIFTAVFLLRTQCEIA